MILPNYMDIVLYNYHGEYLSVLHNPAWVPERARAFIACNLNAMEDADLKLDLNTLPDVIRPLWDAFNTGAEIPGGYIITVHGTPKEHRVLFDLMLEDLMPGPQGADDDTFDYWPGAVETLELYAHQLWDITHDSHYKVAMGRLATQNSDVPEWDDSALALIEWSKP